MEICVDKRGDTVNEENSIRKRKRLDARAFREWHSSLAKKQKSAIGGGTSPQSPGKMLHAGSDDLEASRLKEQQHVSKIRHSNCKEQRMLEVKSEPDNEEVAKQKHGASVKGCEQASSATNADLHEKSLCKMIEDGAPDNEVHASYDKNRASDGTNKDEMQGESNSSVPRSEELSDFKASSTRFTEYWVPAGFSQLQLEQYCEILVKNTLSLCSSKKGITDVLHDILNTIRKCCDHPYIVDQSLARFVNEGRSAVDSLSAGIEVSGKLLLLDKFLQEAKEKEARVLIVFQSNYPHSLQHILDDFICRRFGEESYVHVYREFDSTKKQAVLDLFNNDKKSGRFVVLIEKTSCQPSIKLSSVDFVILFNSDWTPANDMKAIQKMSIQSRSDHVKVFRLYLAHSVEEKVLSLAKKGLETRSSNFSLDSTHTLLLWGTPYLFSKLDDFHSHSSLENSNTLVEQKLLHDVLHEFSGLLSCQNTEKSGISLISKFQEGRSDVEDISLYGEKDALHRDDDLPPHALWISLLEGRNPRWKLLPGSSEKIKRRGECEAKDDMTMSNKVVVCASKGESLSVKPTVRKPRSPMSGRKARKLVGYSTSGGDVDKFLSCTKYNDNYTVEKACTTRMKRLLSKQKDEIREFHRTKREKRAELEEEHQLELDITSQKYGETARKQEELKKLDDVYKAKVKELDRQMDRKMKALGLAQRASRIKEKQLKDRLLALSKTKDLAAPITSPSGAPLLNSRPESQKRCSGSPLQMANSLSSSEKQCSRGSERNMVDGSSRSDCGVLPNQLLAETEVLSGDGSTNMEPSGDNLPGVNVHVNTPLEGSLSPSLESHGENDMSNSSEKAPDATAKRVSDASDLRTLDDHQLSGLKNTETFSNLADKELHDGGNYKEALVGASNEETENRDAGLDTTSQQIRTKDMTTKEQPRSDSQQCLLSAQNCSEPLSTLPNREVQSGENDEMEEPHVGGCNGEREGRGAVGLCTISNVARKESVGNLAELPSSRPSTPSCISTQPQTCTITENSSPLEQPMTCTTQEMRETVRPSAIPCNQTTQGLRQADSPLAILGSQTTGTASSCQADQLQALLRNLESSYSHLLPAVQPVAITTTSLQPSVTHDLTHNSSLTTTSILPPVANGSLPGLSSSRFDISPPSRSHPLENELVRMQKEEEEVINLHNEQVILIESARTKEIEEINKKYDLLKQEVENASVKKKEDLRSHYQKVCANKILAETMILFTTKPENFEMPLDGQLSSQQHQTLGLGISPRAQHTAPPVEVVRQSTGLTPFDPLNTTGYPLMGYQTRDPASHPSSYQAISSMPITHSPSPFHGVPVHVQQNHVGPQNSLLRSYPIDCSSGPVVQHDGSQENPILL